MPELLMLAFADFPAHVRLMLLAARTRLREQEAGQIEALTADSSLDWTAFLAVTAHHRLSPLVFQTLDTLVSQKQATLPADVHTELQRRARVNAFEALRSAAEVRRITSSYAAAGMELAVLKGVPLSQFLFDNPATRHVGDIDLLTQPAQLPEQMELLAGLGYRRTNPRMRLTPYRIAAYVSFWKDFTFRNEVSGFDLDLHWRLFNNRFHAANRILAEASYRTVDCFGVPMRCFSPVEQFIYIAAHGLLDAWTYLKSLADVAAFLRVFTPAELDQALVRAEQLGMLAQISAAIHLANDWMAAGVANPRLLPQEERVARFIRRRTTAMLRQQNFKPERNYPSPIEWLQLEVGLVPGVRSLTEIARRFVWRPRVWATVDLPDSLFWFYPVLGLLLLPRFHTVDE